jgi:hypothetical protein
VLLPIPAKTTVDLAALVRDVPELLGMDGDGAPCRAAVTLSEQGDTRVLAAIDEAGGICLVGYPSQLTREVLTVVARELIVLSGRFWRMPLEEFAAVIEKGLGRSICEHFAGRAAKDWSEAGFRAGLRQSLERGRFPVVLLVAGTNKELVETIVHLKSHNLAVKPLGVELYESWGIEVVVPKALVIPELGMHEGMEQAKAVPRPAPPPRTPQRFQISSAQVANVGVRDSAPQPGSAPANRMPWSDQPSPQAAKPRPAPVELKPVAAEPQPAPKSPPAAKPVWDGSMPGVMAGKRPPPKPADESQPRKGQEPPKGRR